MEKNHTLNGNYSPIRRKRAERKLRGENDRVQYFKKYMIENGKNCNQKKKVCPYQMRGMLQTESSGEQRGGEKKRHLKAYCDSSALDFQGGNGESPEFGR